MFDSDPENNRSMFGGKLRQASRFVRVDPVPTVGFAIGDVTLENCLRSNDLAPKLESETELYVALVGDVFEGAQKIVAKLREEGVCVAVDMTRRKLGKQIEVAVKKAFSICY